jgi:hypothetical protein
VKKQLEIPHAHSEAIQLVSVCKVSKWLLKARQLDCKQMVLRGDSAGFCIQSKQMVFRGNSAGFCIQNKHMVFIGDSAGFCIQSKHMIFICDLAGFCIQNKYANGF